ncbi:hypothetical protein VaNZ11_001485 [Volvox africanus]|uniref:Uncharacterized protein n=1 Tax=Volvox africanus TaxID=51714 RepID=A0ABQ5RPZ0_9CHLO|nr:hypothetical protein VaNZ11_001485 [Volvox africanus]
MDEGPRYPGSLVVQHVKQQTLELVDKYRRRRKRATELPRAASLLLAWEGAIVAGAFLVAIAHVAASAYMMERFDERTRRTSLVRYYQQRTELAAEAVRHVQESIVYYSRHAAAVERQLESTNTAARECRQRVLERRRQLEKELAAGLGREAGPSDSVGGSGTLASVLAPWRVFYVRLRLDGWRRELESLDREAGQLEQSLQHDQRLAEQARSKLRSLAKELRREAAAYEALHARLSAWRSYSCRSLVFSGGAQLGLPGLSWPGGSQQHGDRRAPGIEGIHKEDVEGGAARGDGDKDEDALNWGSSRTNSSEQMLWSWTMQVYTPAWMGDEESFDPPPPRGEAPGDRDDEEQEDEEGDNTGENELGKWEEGGIGEFLSEVRPLLENALSRW